LIIHTGPLPNPAQLLLVDLVSRTGSPTMHSLSPYNGMRKVLFQQVPNGDLSRIIDMLKTQPDYDADHQKPVAGPYVKNKPDGPYLRRLEDIDESWVQKYLENVLTGIKINKSGGMREYASHHREANTFRNSEGDTIEEGELLVDSPTYKAMDIAEAKSKLPYLLKRLYDKSLEMKVSAMSLIIAYEKAKIVRKVPRPKDILEVGVYKMGKDGNLEGLFPLTANSGKVFPPACDWIRGFNRMDPYFADAVELIRVCEVLGIDIRDEDPRDYQKDDIAKLKVTYISKNRDYLSGSRQRNITVLDSLSSIKVSDYGIARKQAPPISVRVMNTVQAILDCDDPTIQSILRQDPDAKAMNGFFHIYGQVAKDFRVTKKQHMEMLAVRRRAKLEDPKTLLVPVLEDFVTRDGFLCSLAGGSIPHVFRVKKYVDQEQVCADIAIAHASGYFFLVTEDNYVYYLDAVELGAYVNDFQRNVFTNRYSKNHKYGRWEFCFV